MFYGRKGLPVAVISVIDLAIWDLLGKIRNEPVYKMIGGATRERLDFYCTGPEPAAAKEMGFFGAKVPLPYSPGEGHEGLKKNVEFLKKHREAIGPDFPLMVDCYMSLNVPYTIEVVQACKDLGLNINWWEECLSPDDFDGQALLKRAHPTVKFTTGEHEYSRYGMRKLIEGRNVDILQPDVMWVGGMTELLKVSAMAAAYDLPVVPHASGPYSYVMSYMTALDGSLLTHSQLPFRCFSSKLTISRVPCQLPRRKVCFTSVRGSLYQRTYSSKGLLGCLSIGQTWFWS
jgi:L-alanine-DL-glutamate epimerase-like enolase superfamily enzyme